ncbi:hypothetical protein PG994_004057 [Apiospora phragmitis]|uniref:Luciferase domain-containing protein n=1 Tax=Apiospora phragmitis TaxID=2905665 RepID=A0ABR1VZV0_9PEZI
MVLRRLLESYSSIAPRYSAVAYLTSLMEQTSPPSATVWTEPTSVSAIPTQSPLLSDPVWAVAQPARLPVTAAESALHSYAELALAQLALLWANMVKIWFDGPWETICSLLSMLYHAFDKVCLQSRFFTHYFLPLLCLWLIYRAFRLVSDGYEAYLDLGRGGTPSTFKGWIRTLRLKHTARLDVLQPPRIPPFLDLYRGRLFELAPRLGPRPTMKGVAPQRQADQKASPSTFFRLSNMLAAEAQAHPQHLRIATSFLEGHLQALRKVVPEGQLMGPDDKNGAWEHGGEIAHPHRLDSSMHVVLHPEDVRAVIEAGWGERHPLAIATPFWKWLHHKWESNRRPVPEYLVILYAPRTARDYEVFNSIIQAAVWFATGGEVYPIDENTYPLAEDEPQQ